MSGWKVFERADVARLLVEGNIDPARCKLEELCIELNSAALHFKMRRDELAEPTGTRLEKDLSRIAALARDLAVGLGAEPTSFPQERDAFQAEDYRTSIWRNITDAAGVGTVAPAYLLRALHRAISRAETTPVPDIDSVPLEARRVVTVLALLALLAHDDVKRELKVAASQKSPWGGPSWVTLMMRLIEIYEPLGKRAGFSRSVDQEPGGPFFRFAFTTIEHIRTKLRAEHSQQDDLQSNSPKKSAVPDLIRTAKKELDRFRRGPPRS